MNHHYQQRIQSRVIAGVMHNQVFFLRLGISIAVLASLAMVIGYIMSVNAMAVRGYAIKELQKKISELEAEGRVLNHQAAALQSADRVEQQLSRLDNMVEVGSPEFIKPQSPVVRVR